MLTGGVSRSDSDGGEHRPGDLRIAEDKADKWIDKAGRCDGVETPKTWCEYSE